MQEIKFAFVILSIVTIAHNSVQEEILSDDIDVCRLFKDGVKLRKPGYCDRGITCSNHKSGQPTECPVSKPYFDKNNGKCKNSPIKLEDYCKKTCKKTSPTFVSDKTNCEGWYKCSGTTKLGSGYCENRMHFNETKQACIYSNLSTCQATYNVCDIAPPDTPYKDEKNCNKYYTCKDSKAVSNACPSDKYFDVDIGQCERKALVPCSTYPYPDNACGTEKLPKRNQFVSDGATCRGYLYCKDIGTKQNDTSPHWGQCDLDKFFKESTQVCLTRTHVTCNEDRCDGRESGYELSGTYGCRNYLVCKNNVTVNEEDCGPNLYFNAEKEECTSQKISYPACS